MLAAPSDGNKVARLRGASEQCGVWDSTRGPRARAVEAAGLSHGCAPLQAQKRQREERARSERKIRRSSSAMITVVEKTASSTPSAWIPRNSARRAETPRHTRASIAMADTSLSIPETSLSIRELKQELAQRGIDCDSCVEKQELVQLLHDASAPASKRARPTPSSSALAPPTPLSSTLASPTTTTCTAPCAHEAWAKRRLRAALPRSFLPKEPDPERLFEAHAAPPLHGDAHLRIATWNLLETVTGPKDPRGIHAVFDVRRIELVGVRVGVS